MLTIDVKNRFGLGDRVELLTPRGNLPLVIEQLENLKGEQVDVAPGSGHVVRLPLAIDLGLASDGGYAMLMRA